MPKPAPVFWPTHAVKRCAPGWRSQRSLRSKGSIVSDWSWRRKAFSTSAAADFAGSSRPVSGRTTRRACPAHPVSKDCRRSSSSAINKEPPLFTKATIATVSADANSFGHCHSELFFEHCDPVNIAVWSADMAGDSERFAVRRERIFSADVVLFGFTFDR
jgi:hypothetical protein